MHSILGIISDSHGRFETTRRAVRMLLDAGADCLIHLGDAGSDRVIDELVGFDSHLVLGNCDYDEAALRNYAESVDVRVHHPAGVLRINGRTIGFTHGHLESCVRDLIRRRVDYLLLGHTHEVRDERLGGTRIINPGALFRARRYTAAVLEPATDRLTIVELPR